MYHLNPLVFFEPVVSNKRYNWASDPQTQTNGWYLFLQYWIVCWFSNSCSSGTNELIMWQQVYLSGESRVGPQRENTIFLATSASSKRISEPFNSQHHSSCEYSPTTQDFKPCMASGKWEYSFTTISYFFFSIFFFFCLIWALKEEKEEKKRKKEARSFFFLLKWKRQNKTSKGISAIYFSLL